MDEHAPNYPDVLQQLLIILHHAALGQWAPEAIRRDDDADRILAIAQRVSAEDLQLFYQIGLIGQRDLPLSPDPRSGFEMVMLRMMAFRPAAADQSLGPTAKPALSSPAKVTARAKDEVSVPVTPRSANPQSHESPVRSIAEPAVVASPLPEVRSSEPVQPLPLAFTEPAPATVLPGSVDWPALIQAMGLTAMTRELANNCVLIRLDEESCQLSLEPRLTHLKSPRAEAGLEKSVQTHFNRPIKLQIRLEAPEQETPALQIQREKDERQQAAVDEIEQDEGVLALKATFDARIVPGSIKPL
jgi:DNA polymerase-3 subunit gamma/tau